MKRHLLGLALGALVGSFVLGGDAQACHGKKRCAAPTPTCAPAPVCAPAPAPVCPAPVVETCAPAPKKHCFGGFKGMNLGHGLKKFGGFCNKGAAAPVCEEGYYGAAYGAPQGYAPAAAPVYAAPQGGYASPQVYGAPQAAAQH